MLEKGQIVMKYGIAVLLLLLLLLLLTKIQVTFEYREKKASLHIRVWGISFQPRVKEEKPGKEKTVKRKEPESQDESEEKSFLKRLSGWRAFWKESKPVFQKALRRAGKKLRIHQLELFYEGGFEDAAVTAVSYGIISGLVYEIYAMIQHFVGVEQSKIQILPNFQKAGLRMEAKWQLSFRIWHLGYIGSALLPVFRIRKKLNL